MSKTAIAVETAPIPTSPLSQAIRKGNILAIAGQLGEDPATGDYVSDDFEAQLRQALANLKAVLAGGGATVDDVVQVRIFLADAKYMPLVNGPYTEVFGKPYPARTTVVVGFPGSMLVEIDALAVLD